MLHVLVFKSNCQRCAICQLRNLQPKLYVNFIEHTCALLQILSFMRSESNDRSKVMSPFKYVELEQF